MDAVILEFDKALRTVFARASSRRPMPAEELPEPALDEPERRRAAALMRVNHCGEVCAQALYRGQALASRNENVRHKLESAAQEETDHLNWTERRIAGLGGHKSFLNPLWYAGSFLIGAFAGRLGDARSLGFLAETERQVGVHLDSHLARLPIHDEKSRLVLEQMKADEARHAHTAQALGAATVPPPVELAMKLSARLMTGVSYYV